MVNAKLHIICGNCWCNNEFTFIEHKGDEYCPADVGITCNNCSTIHSLSDNADREVE